jgi:SHS family lactate transporter-like MFS transporter
MTLLQPFRSLNPMQRRAFTACFLGWTLDAFDFFLLNLCLDSIAVDFHISLQTATKAIFWTLLMRPVGALLFGVLAEKMGRRPALMLNIVCFSVFELASAFAPGFGIFLATRALFGIAMGGEWGVGVALALETLPAEGRGFFSGLLQEGYAVGYTLAAMVYLLFPFLHGHGMFVAWRVLFMIGALPSLLVLYVRNKVEESPAWLAARERPAVVTEPWLRQVVQHLPKFLFLVVLLTAFMSFSHGTQDLYPTFLKHDHGVRPGLVSVIVIVGNVGAVVGGVFFGSMSQRWGRRRAIVIAALLSLVAIPMWAFSHSLVLLALGGFVMQFLVQGAWGVIPVHLNELSPPAVRTLFPGLAYQLGNVFASRNSVFQSAAAVHFFGGRFGPVMAITVAGVAVVLALVTSLGAEAKGADLSTV